MNNSYSTDDQAFLVAVGQTIRDFRLEAGLSQEAFARACGLDRTYISDVERGERNLSLLNLKKIADGLKVSMSALIS